MSGSELDPLFMKGLRLLHSKSKDSTEQLKQLLDEAIAQSKQSTQPKDRIYTSVKLDGESKLHIKKASREAPDITGFTLKYPTEEPREKKAEKRPAEKNKPDILEVEAKIPKLEPPQVYSYYPSSPDIPKLDQYDTKKDTDSSDEKEDADDFAVEMGLACIICSSLDVTQGNRLMECLECHNLYHQECHRPPITDFDYEDPRSVWYCAKCIKNMKKMATKTQKTAKSSLTSSSKESLSQAKPAKSDNSPPALILPFKRVEPKTTISQASNSQSSANKPIGLAGLAANFGNRAVSSSSTSSSTSLAAATRGSKPGSASKISFATTATTKTSSLSTSTSGSLVKAPASSTFSTTSQSSTSSSQKTSSTTTTATKGLGLLSAAVAASTVSSRSTASAAAAATAGNGGKVPSCSPLMSADKRLQIMKKKASKMQERRRMSNK